MKRILFILGFATLLLGCDKLKTACYSCKTKYTPVIDSMWISLIFCPKIDTICHLTVDEIKQHERTNTVAFKSIVRLWDLTNYYDPNRHRDSAWSSASKDSLITMLQDCNCEEIIK